MRRNRFTDSSEYWIFEKNVCTPAVDDDDDDEDDIIVLYYPRERSDDGSIAVLAPIRPLRMVVVFWWMLFENFYDSVNQRPLFVTPRDTLNCNLAYFALYV